MPYGARVFVRVNVVIGAIAAAVAAVLAVVFVVFGSGDDEAKDEATAAAATFVYSWAAEDFDRAGSATDAPEKAAGALEEAAVRLSMSSIAVTGLDVSLDNSAHAGTARFTVRSTLSGLGDWTYQSAAPLVKTEDGWTVHWESRIIHPQLTAQTRLGRERQIPERAPILDRNRTPLVTDRAVITFGIWPSKLTDPDRAYQEIGDNLDVDVANLRDRVAKAPKDQFVEIITLRESAAATAAAALDGIPGIVQRPGTRPLAPTREFARAVLGTVLLATAETLRNAGPTASAADLVGSSGLAFAYQKQLAGVASGKVVLVDRETDEPVATLHEFRGASGKPLKTTLDLRVQQAAEAALPDTTKPTALVAIEATTGKILAAANGPGAQDLNRAFVGRYPPGSTFKVVTTAALLANGLSPTESVNCPKTVTIEGKDFGNFESFELGRVPFRTDFAHSCNTAFVSLRNRLDTDALPETAAQFGLGGDWRVGLPVYSGSVPPPAGAVDQAAEMIGQGKVLASPLAMASVAATVAAGEFHQPFLVDDGSARFRPANAVPAGALEELRSLMRAVVLEGSGSALRAMPGEPGAKTGTAEYGDEQPPRTHAWMIGFRGDLAFAVVVEDGGIGGKVAGPIAARFLSALPAS